MDDRRIIMPDASDASRAKAVDMLMDHAMAQCREYQDKTGILMTLEMIDVFCIAYVRGFLQCYHRQVTIEVVDEVVEELS